MTFAIYWAHTAYQDGGTSVEGPPGTFYRVDGVLAVRAEGPAGSIAINGGGYLSRYPDEGPSATASLPPVPAAALISSAPAVTQPNAWEVRAAIGAETSGTLHCWVVVYQP